MTPIEKNVIVVDEFGNEYGATWPKRARGLVKSGRARFIDENRICLACPPNINEITEDIEMSDNKTKKAAETAPAVETIETAEVTETTGNTATKYTLDYVLEQIAKLQADTEHIKTAVSALSHDIQDPSGSRADALCSAVAGREETNRKLIAFYERMYDDLKPKPVDPINEATKRVVTEFISRRADYIAGCDITAEEFETIMNEIQQARYLAENK